MERSHPEGGLWFGEAFKCASRVADAEGGTIGEAAKARIAEGDLKS